MARRERVYGGREVRPWNLGCSYGVAALISMALWAALIAALWALL